MHLTVKPTRTQQRGVQNVGAVGRGHDNDTFVGLKTVHLNQKLVQRLLPLIVATAVACATGPAHGVDLIDEHDAGRVLLRLLEHVAYAGGTHTHKHLNKIRTRDGEERHTRLTGHGPCEQRLTRTGRAHKQRTFGDFTTQAAEFLRISEELNDLFEIIFGLINARHIVKRHTALFFGEQFGLGFTKAHCPTFAAALHPVHEENPDADQHEERQPKRDRGHKSGLFLRLCADDDFVVQKRLGHVHISGLDGHLLLAIRAAEQNTLAVQRHGVHSAAFDLRDKVRIGCCAGIGRRLTTREQVEQRQDQDEQNDPKGDISRVTQGDTPSSVARREGHTSCPKDKRDGANFNGIRGM